MYVQLTDGDQWDSYVIDNFNSYAPTLAAIKAVWKDHQANGTSAEVFICRGVPPYDANLVRDGNSMRYVFENNYEPYYSEANATIGTGAGKLNIDPDWLGLGAQTLSLWFYGQPNNDANQQMYIKLVDSDNPPHTATVEYRHCDMNDIRERKWHQWNIPLTDFAGVNLADVNKIIIGFGDGTPAEYDGTVYFDDIRLYTEYPPRPHTAKVLYKGIPYRLMEQWWHVWNIPFTELNDVNLANVKTIAIGFGDGNAPYANTGEGTVYFDDIVLGKASAEDPFYDGAVYLEEDPFVNSYLGYRLFINQGCPLIEAGAGYIDEYPYLIGKASCVYRVPDTNNLHGIPDSNIVNIGFHYFDWNYSNVGGDGNLFPADLNGDKIVNFGDFAVLANYWQQSTPEKMDVDRSGFVDYNDLFILANQWLETQSVLANIVPSFDKDPNNLSGYVQMSIDAPDPNIYRVFALIDGKPYREFFIETEEEEPYVGIQTERFANVPHSIKIIAMDIYGNVICSQVNEVVFNNVLSSVTMSEGYEPNKPYCLYAFGSPGVSYSVDVNDDFNDTAVYSGNFTGNIQAVIPAEAFAADDLIYGLMVRSSSSPEEPKVSELISKTFKKEDYPPDCSTEMVISCGNNDVAKAKMPCIIAVTTAAVKKNMHPIYLSPKYCTWENLEYCLKYIDNVQKWYHVAHGDHDLITEPPRQCIDTASGKVFSYLKRNVEDTSNYTALHWFYENNHSLADLGFFASKKLNWVQFNCCYSGHTTEFAYALGILPIDDPLNVGNRVFIGWENSALVYDIIGRYNKFEKVLWNMLGQGNSLWTSLNEATISVPDGVQIKLNFVCDGLVEMPEGMQYVFFRNGPIN